MGELNKLSIFCSHTLVVGKTKNLCTYFDWGSYKHPKMAKNIDKQKTLLQPMRWSNIHTRGPRFFFFWGDGGVLEFCCSQCVLNVVPSSFQWVPYMFPKGSYCVLQHVPNSSSFYPKSFALNSILVTYINILMEEITT